MTAVGQPADEANGAVKHLVPPRSKVTVCGVPMPDGASPQSPENRTCPACSVVNAVATAMMESDIASGVMAGSDRTYRRYATAAVTAAALLAPQPAADTETDEERGQRMWEEGPDRVWPDGPYTVDPAAELQEEA